MRKFLRFTGLMLRFGTLQSGRNDFNTSRALALQDLQEFVPAKSAYRLQALRTGNHSLFKNLAGQLAFIKQSFKNPGGHLTAGPTAYIRIPKSANTSASLAMLLKAYPALSTKSLDDAQINFLADVNLHTAQEIGTEKFFTVVRNPFARLVSVYRDFFEKEHADFIYQDYLFGVLSPKISFEAFINRIERIPDRFKDQHFKPQVSFLKPYQQKGIDLRILKLEESGALRSFTASHDLELSHRNRSQGEYAFADYYTPETLKKVYDMYKTDIHSLGYENVYHDLKRSVKN